MGICGKFDLSKYAISKCGLSKIHYHFNATRIRSYLQQWLRHIVFGNAKKVEVPKLLAEYHTSLQPL